MNKQGLVYAFLQYFTIDEKPRLYRRNTWFEDHKLSGKSANYFWILFTVLAMALAIFWTVGGLL